MGLSLKHGFVETEHGTIATDEPVFVLRARDSLAIPMLTHYMEICREVGCGKKFTDEVGTALLAFKDWADNGTRFPD